jgi:hypothetical protein
MHFGGLLFLVRDSIFGDDWLMAFSIYNMHFAIIINSTIWPNCFYPIMEDYFDECMQICKITTNIKQMNFWEWIEVKGLENLIAKFKCKLETKKTLFVNFQGVLLGNPQTRKSATLAPP